MKRLLILASLCVALTACDLKPRQPAPDYGLCLAGHTEESVIVMWQSMCVGNSCTQIPYTIPTSDYICDRHEYPLGDGPGYLADVQRYQRELTEWCERHSGECK